MEIYLSSSSSGKNEVDLRLDASTCSVSTSEARQFQLNMGVKVEFEPSAIESVAAERRNNLSWRLWHLSHNSPAVSSSSSQFNPEKILKSPPIWEAQGKTYLSEKHLKVSSSDKNVLEENCINGGQYFRHVGPNPASKKHEGPSGLGLALASANKTEDAQNHNTPMNDKITAIPSPSDLIQCNSENLAPRIFNNINENKLLDATKTPTHLSLSSQSESEDDCFINMRSTFTDYHNMDSSRVAFLGEERSVQSEQSFPVTGKKRSLGFTEIRNNNFIASSMIEKRGSHLMYRPEPTASRFDRVGFNSECYLFAMPQDRHVFSYSPISGSLLPFAFCITPEKARSRLFTRRIPSDFGRFLQVRIAGRQSDKKGVTRWFVCKYNYLFEFDSKNTHEPCGVASLAGTDISLSAGGDRIMLSLYENRICGNETNSKCETGTSAPRSRGAPPNLGSHGSRLDKLAFSCSVKHPQRVLELWIEDNDESESESNKIETLHIIFQKLRAAADLQIEDLYLVYNNKIGQGRFAHVIPAQRKDDGSMCAIKFVNKRDFWALVEVGKERNDTISREIATQLYLTYLSQNRSEKRSGGIVNLRDVFETKDFLIMEMDLMDRVDLFQLVSKNKKLSENHTARIIKHLAKTIQMLRRANIAHRDVKLSNIVFPVSSDKSSYLRPKLTDFGMAAFVDADGLLKGRCGTPGYVAPEILAAKPNQGYYNRVDMFSLGVICYTLLCGYEPFFGEDERKLITSNKTADFGFDDREWSHISLEAKHIIRGMLEKDPQKRLSPEQVLEHPWILANSSRLKRNDNAISGDNMKSKKYVKELDYNFEESKCVDVKDDKSCVVS